MANGQIRYDYASDDRFDNRPCDTATFPQVLVDTYIEQLMTTGSCPALFDCDGEPMSYEEAYKLVIETMTADAELNAA